MSKEKKKLRPSAKRAAKKLSLPKLVAKIKPKNRFAEIATGPEIGKEIVEWRNGRR